MIPNLSDLPENISQVLTKFIMSAKETLSEDLIAVVLFGSAAEGRLRKTSDVNLLLVLSSFELEKMNLIRDQFRFAHAAINLNIMFALQSEINDLSENFGMKFHDIVSRNRILLGQNPFLNLEISRETRKQQLKQSILNLKLRIRERYVLTSLREEQLVHYIAEVSGPIRTFAANILELEGQKFEHPKDALESFVNKLKLNNGESLLQDISDSRKSLVLKNGRAPETVSVLLDLLQHMYEYIQKVK